MPSQIFMVTRAEEAGPVDGLRLRRMLAQARPDTEWDVQECEMQGGALVRCDVARALRERTNATHQARAAANRPDAFVGRLVGKET